VTEILSDGTLYDIPFPRVLFLLWKKEATGRLVIRSPQATERAIFISKGLVMIERDGLSEPDFLKALVKKRILSAESSRRAEKEAGAKGISTLRALGELGIIAALPLWNLLASYFVRRLFPLFDAEDGRFALESGAAPPEGSVLGEVQTLDLILQGIRQIQNPGFLERRVPAAEEIIYLSTPYFLHRLSLEPHERYVLRNLAGLSRLDGFYGRSELGETESRKVVFALLCLDILHVREEGGKAREVSESSAAEQTRILALQNERCACVHKYITKQIGPLARTILGTAVEEVKPGLGPIFLKARLLGDGRIEVDPALSSNTGPLDEELFRQLVRGYDEILMAGVLAVKKALGPAHETALVRNIGKIV
jgi:Domain of unknown function (DUF4388)